jgi:hypothetical protein
MAIRSDLLERALMGAIALAIPAALISGFVVVVRHPDDFFLACAISLAIMLLGAFLAIKRAQPFRWLEEKLRLGK